MTLLETIEQYDRKQQFYIRELEEENDRLRAKNTELVDQLASYVATVDRMKLQLILSGALVRPVKLTESTDSFRERGVRLYCTQSGSEWTLQVRSPISLGSSRHGRDGKDFVIAGAPLDLEGMRALRDAMSAFIAEAEKWGSP